MTLPLTLKAGLGVALRASDVRQMHVRLEFHESHVALIVATPFILAAILRV